MKKKVNLQSAYLAILSAFFCMTVSSAANAEGLLFNSDERRSSVLDEFPKWNGVLERTDTLENESDAEEDKCTSAHSICKLKKFLTSIKSLPPKEQIDKVNAYHNKQRYVQDISNWGIRDYWATMMEFINRDGDCEDYAIAKYMSLKKLGFDTDHMRIVVLQDENLRVMHSVLAVYEDDKIYILDNQTKSVLEDKRIHHYTPIYSINEHAWWRHLPRTL